MPVEQGAPPRLPRLQRRLLDGARALTTPLRPDDYIGLINPMWSARELQGTIVRIHPEGLGSVTVVIRPNFPWAGHRPGQYLRIGVQLDGVRHWRAYSLTSDFPHPEGLISVSPRMVEDGLMSTFFNRHARPGTVVYLGEVEGTFCLPDPPPEKLLMISAGSGVTPVWAMLRGLAREGADSDVVHVHCERTPEQVMFADRLEQLPKWLPGYRRIEHLTSEAGRLEPKDLDEVCPDWRERSTYLSGPPAMLDAFCEYFEEQGLRDRLELEHFQPFLPDGGAGGTGEGGSVRFRVTDFETECDGQTPILVAGEQAGAELSYGCRMGICHTCVCKLVGGKVRDLRNGEVYGEPGEMIRICISAPEGDVELDEGRVVIPGTRARNKA